MAMCCALSTLSSYAKRRNRVRSEKMATEIKQLQAELRCHQEREEATRHEIKRMKEELDQANLSSAQLRGHGLEALSTPFVQELILANEEAAVSLKKEMHNREREEMRLQLEEEMKAKMEAALSSPSQSPSCSPLPTTPTVDHKKECAICLSDNVEHWVKFSPCRHVCVCAICAGKVDACPLCKSDIEAYEEVFL